MFWSSKALSWLVPSLFLTTPIGGTIVVVSPWVEDIDLQVYNWQGSYTLEGKVSLSSIILWLHKQYAINFVFYVREDQLQPVMNKRLDGVYKRVNGAASFHGILNLHAKMIITDTNVLETTANLLTNSIYKNVETTTLYTNQDISANDFAKHFFARHGLLLY